MKLWEIEPDTESELYYTLDSCGNKLSKVEIVAFYFKLKTNDSRNIVKRFYLPAIPTQYFDRIKKDYLLFLGMRKYYFITDSLELAEANKNHILNSNGNILISFLVDSKIDPLIERSEFYKRATMFLILREHSNLSRRELFKRINRVISNINDEKRIKIISYLKDYDKIFAQGNSYTPEILDIKDIKYCLDASPYCSVSDIHVTPAKSDYYTIFPIIKKSTTNLLYGDPKAGKTLFGIHLAYAIFFPTWPNLFRNLWHLNRANVVYCLRENKFHTHIENLYSLIIRLESHRKDDWDVNRLLFLNSFRRKIEGDIKQSQSFYIEDWPKNLRFLFVNSKEFELIRKKDRDKLTQVVMETQSLIYSEKDTFLILDGFYFGHNLDVLDKINKWLTELNNSNITILIITSGDIMSRKKLNFLLKLPLDTILEMEKTLSNNPDSLSAILTVKKRPVTEDYYISRYHLSCSYQIESCQDVFSSNNALLRIPYFYWHYTLPPREILKNELRLLHHNNHTGPQIAKMLGISLSLVKKLKREMGLKKKK